MRRQTREPLHQVSKVATRELPLERASNVGIVLLEAQDTILDIAGGDEVVGSEDLALKNREVDLDLIKPTGVHWGVDEHQIGPAALKTLYACLTSMRRSVVHDPEHATSRAVRLAGHDLLDQPVERLDAGTGFASSEDARLPYVPSRKVSNGSLALVLVLDPHHPARAWRQRSVNSAAGLYAGLLIGGNDTIIVRQEIAIPQAFVQVENTTSLALEIGITREHPTAVVPGLDGVLGEPTPNRLLPDRSNDAAGKGRSLQLRHTKARKGEPSLVGEFTGQSLDGDDDVGGKSSPAARVGERHRAPRDVPRKIVCATC